MKTYREGRDYEGVRSMRRSSIARLGVLTMPDQMRRSQARTACEEDEGCLVGPG